jgi:hypothetical protein
MHKEYIFILNDIEKQVAGELVGRLVSGEFPPHKLTTQTNDLNYEISYEFCPDKQEKIVRGLILNCHYKLRYRDANRIFFSAWDCKDVCAVFYDMIMLLYAMNQTETRLLEKQLPFVPDLHTEQYVFCTDQYAVSFTDMADFFLETSERTSYNSQYILSLFKESDEGGYGALFEAFKATGYSSVRIFQIWIRSEILYYVLADGVVLRPEHQRFLTPKEEADVMRKIHKSVNDRFKSIDLSDASIYT